MNGPKMKYDDSVPNDTHVELMQAELDKLVPNHPNGEASEGPQCERKITGSGEEQSR